MSTPSARELEVQVDPGRGRELPHEVLTRIREHSKRMFGNQDRLQVAVAITRVEIGRINATDLHRDTGIAVNRVRAQLLALESLGLLRRTGNEEGKRVFERLNRDDRFWAFALGEYQDQLHASHVALP